MALTPGTRIGPYEVVGSLGAGGMGEVYRATDTNLGRHVAIKVLPEAFATDSERLARFAREARTLAALNHPNIAAIYGVENSGPSTGSGHAAIALVMELVEGPTLADRITDGAMPIVDALHVARQIAEALEAAHEQGIVHRDLKPANIKLRPDGTVKVLDFGLAKAMEPAAALSPGLSVSPTITTPAMTQAGVILGTAAYMSPEQVKGRQADKRSDVWSFGCVLFEMLTGARPFVGDDVSDTLASVLRSEPAWTKLPDAVPASIRRLLRRCLQKDRRDRLADLADARLEIADALAHPDEERSSEPTKLASQRQLAILRWALAAALVMAIGIALWAMRSTAPEPAPLVQLQLVPKDINIGSGTIPQISPDGRFVAFGGRGTDGIFRIYLRALDTQDTKPLTGTESVQVTGYLFWSLDSHQIAFSTPGKLMKIGVAGGLPQTLCDLSVSSIVVGGSWNRDGVIIFGDAAGGIMRGSASGGPCQPLTRPERNESNHLFPVFLPDGKHFLYLRSRQDGPDFTTDLYVGSLDAPPDNQKLKKVMRTGYSTQFVPASGSSASQLLFVRDATLFAQPFDPNLLELTGEAAPLEGNIGTLYNDAYFSASMNGVLVYRTSDSNDHQLTWFDPQGQAISESGDPIFPRTLAVTRDGRQAAFESLADGSLMVVDLLRGTKSRLGVSNGQGVAWSPDGRVAFAAGYDMQVRQANGAREAETLVTSSQFKYPLDWSSDGRYVLYRVDSLKTKADVWAVPVEGERTPFAVVQSASNEQTAKFSPDGRWVAYTSDESGQTEVHIRAFAPPSVRPHADDEGPQTISRGAVFGLVGWRFDGKQLWYSRPDGTIMGVDLSMSPAFHVGEPVPLFKVPTSTIGGATDGRRFLLAVPSKRSTQVPITVVLNWPNLIKK